MATQKGVGTVFGSSGSADCYGSAAVKIQKAGLKDDFDKKYIKDSQGAILGVIGYNGHRTVDIDFVVGAAASGGLAASIAIFTIPTHCLKVVLSGFDIAVFNGNWIYEGGVSIEVVNDDVAKLSFTLHQYDADVTTAVN